MGQKQHIVAEQVLIWSDCAELKGKLSVPEGAARATVIFAHASANHRTSRENRLVAERLEEAGIGTLLFNLLTETEAQNPRNILDIHRLTHRLMGATDWLIRRSGGKRSRVGYFGAGPGGAAAIIAAAANDAVGAVVTRDGRPDLACYSLPRVKAPTLLIVGGEDAAVVTLHQRACERLTCMKSLEVVPHATQLLEERGARDQVARLAREWFTRHLQPPHTAEVERTMPSRHREETSGGARGDAAEPRPRAGGSSYVTEPP